MLKTQAQALVSMASPPPFIVSLGYDIKVLEYIDMRLCTKYVRIGIWSKWNVSNCISNFAFKNSHIPFIVHIGIWLWISNVHFLKINNQTI
jgi:hypothetical protein